MKMMWNLALEKMVILNLDLEISNLIYDMICSIYFLKIDGKDLDSVVLEKISIELSSRDEDGLNPAAEMMMMIFLNFCEV